MELEDIEAIALLIREHPVSEICIEDDGGRIRLRKSYSATPSPTPRMDNHSAVTADVFEDTIPTDHPVLLESKIVGIFHHLKPAIRVGAVIDEGQIVGHVESMKVLNDVVADNAGKIAEVYIEDGAPVEYGLPLFRIASV